MAENTKIEIRNTSNEVVTTIESSKTPIDSTTTSINLFAKGVEEYLTEVNENFYGLLENFASKKAPSNPQVGQVWYSKKGSHKVEVKGTGLNYNATRYIKINGVTKNIKNRRGIALMIFDNNFSSKIKSLGYYDTYGSNAARTQLARKLGTVSENEMFVMVSYDAIGTNDNLNARMDRLNSQAWHKVKRNWRYPYAAIGTGKFGIISEDLQEFDDKKHAHSQVAFESLIPDEGMGTHTALTSVSATNDNLLTWNGETWGSSAATLEGKDLKSLRSYVLSGVDLSVKFDKTGGTVNGSVVLNNTLTPKKDIIPTGNEIQDLGTPTKRYRTLHLSEDASIYMGVGKSFNKNSFVYTVEKETESVTNVPAGSLILNRATGEAVVKKSNFKASTSNNTFRKLSQDKKYGVTIGGNNYSFNGDKGIFMGSWRHGTIQKITIPTPGNASVFGSCRSGGHSASCSDGTRGLSFWQHGHSYIQYVTIATPMNAVDFGRFYGGWSGAAASDGTRAVVFAGVYWHSHSHYVLFATPMNAVRFGEIGTSAHWCAAVSDGSKAIFDRGAWGWSDNQYRYVSMATPGNAIYFGKMQASRGWTGAASNGVHGLWAGGHEGWNGTINTVEKLTLASPSNSTHFGNLTYSRHTSSPVANDSTMVAAGGSSYSKTLDYLSFANGGSATKFGNAADGIRYAAYFSGN
jgi:hypothetical protein